LGVFSHIPMSSFLSGIEFSLTAASIADSGSIEKERF